MPEEKENRPKKEISPKREVDAELWEKVQELLRGTSDDKKNCIKIIFGNYYKLPNEVNDIIKSLATSENEEIRISIAKLLKSKPTPRITFGLYSSLIDILTEDQNSEIQSLLKEEIEEKKRLLSTIKSSIIELKEEVNGIISSYNVINKLQRLEIPKDYFITYDLPTIYLQREIISDMLVINKMNQNISKDISNLSSSYYTFNEIKRSYEIEEPKEHQLIKKLDACPPGIGKWIDYQKTVREIMEYTLVPPLAPPTEESQTDTGVQRRDLIFNIPFETSKFWDWIRVVHSSIGVIVDAKNYSDFLPPNQVVINAKYFGERRLGLFGIIATRRGLEPSARKEQIRLWRDEGKMIICLNDEDLKRMISLKESKKNPEIVIDEKIREIRKSIE